MHQLASWYHFTLLGEQRHQSMSSLSIARKSVVSGIKPATFQSLGLCSLFEIRK